MKKFAQIYKANKSQRLFSHLALSGPGFMLWTQTSSGPLTMNQTLNWVLGTDQAHLFSAS